MQDFFHQQYVYNIWHQRLKGVAPSFKKKTGTGWPTFLGIQTRWNTRHCPHKTIGVGFETWPRVDKQKNWRKMSIGGIVLTNKKVVCVCVCVSSWSQTKDREICRFWWFSLDAAWFSQILGFLWWIRVFPWMRCFLRVSHTGPYRPERESPLNTLGETLGLQQLSLYPPWN